MTAWPYRCCTGPWTTTQVRDGLVTVRTWTCAHGRTVTETLGGWTPRTESLRRCDICEGPVEPPALRHEACRVPSSRPKTPGWHRYKRRNAKRVACSRCRRTTLYPAEQQWQWREQPRTGRFRAFERRCPACQ